MNLIIHQFINQPLKNNNYLVADPASKEAILIDCSCPEDDMIQWANTNGFQIKYILLTHAHFDHVLGVNHYLKAHGITAYLYKKDEKLLNRINEYTQLLHFPTVEIPKVQYFDLNTSFTIGKYPIKIIPTPGHTMGSVCYLIDGNLFSGDTLFKGTFGRTDLPESDENAMQQSLASLFQQLPDETLVYPGHGASTNIQQERALYKFD